MATDTEIKWVSAEEQEAAKSSADKKTDESKELPPQPTGGLLWRFSSGVVGTATGVVTGTVGYGFGAVKWVAGKGLDVGSAVVHKTADAGSAVTSRLPLPKSVPFLSRKDKKE